MTRRRDVLSGSAILSISTIAGCIDSISEDNQGNGDNQNNAANPSNTRSEDQTPTNTEPEEESTTEANNVEDKENILEKYKTGIRTQNDGTAYLNDAIDDGSNGDHVGTENMAEKARSKYNQAQDYFSDAVDLTYEIENQEAREICEEAEEGAQLYYQAAGFLRRSARRAQDREFDRAQNLWDISEERSNEAERIGVEGSSTLELVLGLD
ncbi:hypothetical protein [Halomontanus rarus]|uniref:hypothetical protein n=1 Tax=Halomontanus rarus TaxID=3034020 RepID=UPI0023E7D289|nr:hypothetical protein [Halovivax sp. TS33]